MSWQKFAQIILGAAALSIASVSMAQTDEPAGPASSSGTKTAASTPIPDEFVDPETHLRILHLSRIPNERSGVIYFTYPSFTQDSRFALIDVQFEDKWRYLYRFDFQTQAVAPLVVDRLTQDQVVAPKSGNVYYMADNAAWVLNIREGTPRKIADLPPKWSPGAGFSVNADETMLLGGSSDVEGSGAVPPTTKPAATVTTAARTASLGQTFGQHQPNVLFTVNIKSGEVKVIHRIDTWIGHVQFSPTDPDLAMYCHEGPWQSVDRIWTIRLSTQEPKLVFKRTQPAEIAGHEFWAPDGKSVWFQQSIRNTNIGFVSGQNLETGKLTQYAVPIGGRGIHYTWSPDGTVMISDGNGKTATGPDKYLSLLIPNGDHMDVKHLCSLQKNDYAVEPNPHMSPDNKWIIFTATLYGTAQAYAVEVPPAMLPKH